MFPAPPASISAVVVVAVLAAAIISDLGFGRICNNSRELFVPGLSFDVLLNEIVSSGIIGAMLPCLRGGGHAHAVV